MPVATNFGDALTQGNAVFQQNLFVQGSTAVFSGNITSSTSTVRLANSTTQYASLYSAGATITTLNVSGSANITSTGVFTNLVSTVNVVSTNFSSNDTFTGNLINTSTLVASSNIGVGTAPVPMGANLIISGNLWAPNIFSTNIFSTNLNATTANIFSVFGVVNTPTTLVGNLYASNGVTSVTVLAAGLVNATTVNVTTLITNEDFSVDNYSGANLVITGNITYSEDLMNRGPWLLPSAANAAAIQAWISTTCNAASIPTRAHWAGGSPVFSNVTSGPLAGNEYCGGVLLPDGRVLFVPSSASNVGFFNPADSSFSTIVPAGLTSAVNKYRGGVLAPNGNVIFVPFQTSNVGVFNPMTSVFSNIGPFNVGINGFESGVLARNGKVIFVPRESANVGIFDHTTLTMSNLAVQGANQTGFLGGVLLPNGNVAFIPGNSRNVGMLAADQSSFSNVGPFFTSGSSKFVGGVLAPNGNVIMTPGFSTLANVGIFNPANSTCSNVQTRVAGGAGAFQGAALIPTGNIVFAPCVTGNVGMFDPATLTYSNLTVGSLNSTTQNKFYGATLIPDGRVVFTPMAVQNVCTLSGVAPAPVEFCLSPYFNKF